MKKYDLTNFSFFVGNAKEKREIEELIKSYSKKPIFIFGPSGTGKTAIARFSAAKFNLQLIETELDESLLLASKTQKGLDGRARILLIEDIDFYHSDQFAFLAQLFRSSQIPIILTAQRNVLPKNLRFRCNIFEFKRINPKELFDFISLIAANERLNLTRQEKLRLITESRGDLRALFFALEFGIGKPKVESHSRYGPRKRVIEAIKGSSSFSDFQRRQEQFEVLDLIEARKQYSYFDKLREILANI